MRVTNAAETQKPDEAVLVDLVPDGDAISGMTATCKGEGRRQGKVRETSKPLNRDKYRKQEVCEILETASETSSTAAVRGSLSGLADLERLQGFTAWAN